MRRPPAARCALMKRTICGKRCPPCEQCRAHAYSTHHSLLMQLILARFPVGVAGEQSWASFLYPTPRCWRAFFQQEAPLLHIYCSRRGTPLPPSSRRPPRHLFISSSPPRRVTCLALCGATASSWQLRHARCSRGAMMMQVHSMLQRIETVVR